MNDNSGETATKKVSKKKKSKSKKVICYICNAEVEATSVEGLFSHPLIEACLVKLTDENGVSLDELYEIAEDGTIFEISSPLLEEPVEGDTTFHVSLEGSNDGESLVVVPEPLIQIDMGKSQSRSKIAKGNTEFAVSLLPAYGHDKAINELFEEAGVPKLGGASGDLGWSSFGYFQRCPYLWKRNYLDGERYSDIVPMPLIVGSLMHLFLALYYQRMLDPAYPEPEYAKEFFEEKGVDPEAVFTAWKIYDSYIAFYNDDYIEPLAVEYHTVDPKTKESCRYDALIRTTKDVGSYKQGTYILEHKCLLSLNKMWDYNSNKLLTVGEMFNAGIAPKVLSYDIKNDKLVQVQAGYFKATEVRDVYELETEFGRTVSTSSNHPFLTATGWKAMDKLTTDDWVAIPEQTAVGKFDSEFTDAEIKLLASLISEGGASGSINWSQNKGDVSDWFCNLLEKELKLPVDEWRIEKSQYNKPRMLQISFSTAKDTYVRELLQRLSLYGLRSAEKKIPKELFNISDKQTGMFLGVLWDGDGAVETQVKGGKSVACIRYTTASKQLAVDVQHMLLRLGIASSVNKQFVRIDGEEFISYKTTVVTHESKRRFLSYLLDGVLFSIRVKAFAEEALATVNAESNDDDYLPIAAIEAVISVKPRKDPAISNALSKFKREPGSYLEKRTVLGWGFNESQLNHPIRWEKVKSVTVKDKQMMYDITVPGTHNFVVDDFITHNTSSRFTNDSLEGWVNDGEIIGQVMLYDRLNLKEKFGELQGVIVNICGKQIVSKFHRTWVTPPMWQKTQHGKDLKMWEAYRQLCMSMGSFPRSRANCVNRWGRCGQWDHCASSDSSFAVFEKEKAIKLNK